MHTALQIGGFRLLSWNLWYGSTGRVRRGYLPNAISSKPCCPLVYLRNWRHNLTQVSNQFCHLGDKVFHLIELRFHCGVVHYCRSKLLNCQSKEVYMQGEAHSCSSIFVFISNKQSKIATLHSEYKLISLT